MFTNIYLHHYKLRRFILSNRIAFYIKTEVLKDG